MEVQVRFLEDTEYEWWDNFVDKSPQGFLFSKSWWLDILTSGDFKICIVIEGNEILAGLLIPFISQKKAQHILLTQSLGMLFADFGKGNMRLQKQLTKQKEFTYLILNFAEKHYNHFFQKFHYNYTYWLPFYWKGYKQTSHYTYLINYKNFIPDEEFTRFSKGHKWTINKVRNKSDLKVSECFDLKEFYAEAQKTYERQKMKIGYSYELLEKLHENLMKRGNCKIFKITDSNNVIHAMEYFIYNHKEAYYWLGTSDEEHRDSGGHTYLTWHAINYFCGKVDIFNFGGSMIEQVERNFRNFSAEPYQYFAISKGHRNSVSLVKNKLLKIIKGN